MLKFENDEEELLNGLVEAIGELPDGEAWIEDRIVPIGPRGEVDALLTAMVAGKPLRLLVEARREAYPRDVRETIYQLRNHLAHLPESDREIVPFFVARSISPGARQLLREEKIGFYDLGGTLYIPARHAFIHVDRPAPRNKSRAADSIFQGQKARVMHYVFDQRGDWLSVKRVAEEAEVAAATASETLSEMEKREWVDVEGSGPAKLRRLRATGPLLDAWTAYLAARKPPKVERYYVPASDATNLVDGLDRACREADAAYAITGEAAAQVYAPYLSSISQVRCRIIPGPRLDDALSRMDARRVSEGWNLGLIETRSRGEVTVGENKNGVMLAPPLQVYLDLVQQGTGRSKDMAAHLREETLDG